MHILNWPEDVTSLVLPTLNQKITSSKGFNVKNPVVKQTSEGLTIDLPVKNRDEIDSIIVLETDKVGYLSKI